jgi:hypothetical protein
LTRVWESLFQGSEANEAKLWQSRWKLTPEWIGPRLLVPQLVYWAQNPDGCTQRLAVFPILLDTGQAGPAQFRMDLRHKTPPELMPMWLGEAVAAEERSRMDSTTVPRAPGVPPASEFRLWADAKVVFSSAWYVNCGEAKAAARARMQRAFKRVFFTRRVPQRVEDAMTAYFARLEKYNDSLPTARFKPEHFEWLVRRVVPRSPGDTPETWQEIAPYRAGGNNPMDLKGVKNKARQLARFIEIPVP